MRCAEDGVTESAPRTGIIRRRGRRGLDCGSARQHRQKGLASGARFRRRELPVRRPNRNKSAGLRDGRRPIRLHGGRGLHAITERILNRVFL